MNGVKLGEKHSYTDFGLFLASRPDISTPKVQTSYVQIPGADGSLDMTESLTGTVNYNDRTIKMTFKVIDARSRWSAVYSELQDYLHGQKMKIIFDDDPEFYYEGRLNVDSWKSEKRTATIVISGTVAPYKMEIYSSTEENWVWDSFNFESGIVREYGDIVVDGLKAVNIVGRRKPVIPIFIVNSEDGTGMDVTFKRITYHLDDGTNRIIDIVTSEGMNAMTVKGHGTISIEYKGGRL